MRELIIMTWAVLSIELGMISPAKAEMVTWEEAFNVAENWITLTIENEGSWGGADTAHVNEIYDFKHEERVIGYFCRVQPHGYIVVSLDKELAPVQMYSEMCDIDPESDRDGKDVFKQEMERVLDEIGGLSSPGISLQSYSERQAKGIEHQSMWQSLALDVEDFTDGLESGIILMNYEGGDPPLLTSSWHQNDPYNRKCPSPNIITEFVCDKDHCDVGCTPLAGAQIMRYWAWPPEYDWVHMADRYDYNDVSGRWEDEDDKPLTSTNINAVSKLCHDVGDKAGATYCIWGCETFCWLADCLGCADLLDALEDHFRYSNEADEDVRYIPPTESADDWWGYFIDELNLNRPVVYELGTGLHTIVCDGWKKVGSTRYLHLNYGWDDSDTAWWCFDTQPKRGPGEHIIIRLYPEPAVFPVITTNVKGFDYRYFAYDTVVMADDILFISPNGQFLPGVDLTVQHGKITFSFTRLFSIKGTSAASINLQEGAAMTMHSGAQIRFH